MVSRACLPSSSSLGATFLVLGSSLWLLLRSVFPEVPSREREVRCLSVSVSIELTEGGDRIAGALEAPSTPCTFIPILHYVWNVTLRRGQSHHPHFTSGKPRAETGHGRPACLLPGGRERPASRPDHGPTGDHPSQAPGSHAEEEK